MKILKQQSEFSITKFKKGWSKFFIIQVLFFFALTLSAQSEFKKIDPSFDEREDAYMNRQSKALLEQVDRVLKKYPPQHPEPEARTLGLYLLDAVLHDKYAAFRKPVQQFYRSRMESVLYEIENTTVQEGAMIWKLYNMGFIVRTKSVTIAFDLVRGDSSGSENFGLGDKIMQRFINQCDVLFISHHHRDHVDEWVTRSFVRAGKPVVAPSQVWEGEPVHKLITHLKREAHTVQNLPVQNGEIELKVVIYPGHQMRSHDNNVPLIYTPEGITVSHMGDQINEGDFMPDYEWIDQVAKHHDVDILLPNNWTNDIYRIVQGFEPELVIPGHENEMGHTFDDRVPFWGDEEYLGLEYTKLKRSKYLVVVMTWGESYYYKSAKN